MHLGLNVRHADEQLRGTLTLPNGLGKEVKVAVFAEGDSRPAPRQAGADSRRRRRLAKKIEEGRSDFDVAIATPDLMGRSSQVGACSARRARCRTRRSGPSPPTSARPSSEAKAGKVEYRTDRQAIVHLTIGKASFEGSALLENYAAVIDEIIRAKPAAAKGRYLQTITLTTTMGPGIRVDPGVVREADILAEDVQSAGTDEGDGGGPPPPADVSEPEPATA